MSLTRSSLLQSSWAFSLISCVRISEYTNPIASIFTCHQFSSWTSTLSKCDIVINILDLMREQNAHHLVQWDYLLMPASPIRMTSKSFVKYNLTPRVSIEGELSSHIYKIQSLRGKNQRCLQNTSSFHTDKYIQGWHRKGNKSSQHNKKRNNYFAKGCMVVLLVVPTEIVE